MHCPVDRQAQANCQSLLQVVERLIEEKGIVSFNFSDIAKVAGVSPDTVDALFESKEDLLLCLFLRSAAGGDMEGVLSRYPHLSAQERFLIPMISVLEMASRNRTFMALYSISANSKVWPLASCDRVDRLRERANRFIELIHRLANQAREAGELQESDERLRLLAQMVYFQLYGQATAYESRLVNKLDEQRRSRVQMESILTIVNAFHWNVPVDEPLYLKLAELVSRHIDHHGDDICSCSRCLTANPPSGRQA
ncbi:TetR/AcrR family transcriptional regulator [Ferrimonas futtsuensis]|uniref:TetR/AcrR family transcriptional regulator n=1 Tax=Ferrimonas futtsuensis TaxID=364764 RepID=UPI0003F6FEA3|nr:TetR/AcrR family transcriptional regulator [Ferrimonas futtsuensis]